MKRIKYSIFNVLALLFFTYVLNNCSKPFGGSEVDSLKLYEYGKNVLSNKIDSLTNGRISLYQNEISWSDSITLINTTYDVELVDYYGDRDFAQGKETITNRKDLYDFLKIAHEEKSYKYIIVDIALDKKGTLYDDSLSILIPKMDNVVVARSKEFSLPNSLSDKSGWVDYNINPFQTGFVKYDFGTKDSESLALRVYNERNGKSAISNFCGLFYFDGLRLCQKTSILNFDIRCVMKKENSYDSQDLIANYRYKNLGTDIEDIQKVKDLLRNKIVVIGYISSTNIDLHDTYIGTMSGALINLNAYITLQKGGHLVNFIYVILLFVFYMLLYIIKDIAINKISSPVLLGFIESEFVQILLSFIGWGTFFNIVSFIVYITMDTFYNPWLPTLWFTFVPQLFKLVKSFKTIY